MQYRLEALARARVAEYEPAHPAAIERAVRRDRVRAERSADRSDRLAAGTRELVGDLVRFDDVGSELREQAGDRALAAADSARESDGIGLHMNWFRYCRVSWGPQNRATIPA